MSEATSQIRPLITKATNSISPTIDPKILSSIKYLAKSSDLEIRAASETLISLLHKPHSQIRYLSLQIIHTLFTRSKLFRTLWVPHLQTFLSLTLGFRRNSPLPPPERVAAKLKAEAIEILNSWNEKFGQYYREIKLGCEYLKNIVRVPFPNNRPGVISEREIRTKQILIEKFESLKENYETIMNEVKECVDEIKECLEIICVKDEEVEDEFEVSELQKIRLEAIKEGERVRESDDNKAVFDAIRELYKVLVTRHLVAVQEWISVMVRVDLEDNRFRDAALKEFIDLRNLVQGVKKQCERLGCVLNNREDEEDDDLWEEGKIETYVGSDDKDVVSCNDVKGKNVVVENNLESSSLSSSRSKLLSEAPVMTWGPSFDDWGSARDVLANQRGLELDGHWGRVDLDATIPKEKIAELKLHCSVYKEEESIEIQPCLAPLKKGGLCQRRDLRVCPFHGPVIPRDAGGNPIEQATEETLVKSEEEVVSIEKGKEVVEHLAKQAIKNVREREEDVKAMKRAKREKVKEHNEKVLREAAIASTSYSEAFGENAEEPDRGRSDFHAKKVTLASMLKKKITTKDRLAKRLLNARSRDTSSRQVIQGEDSKYREAFPNQW